MVVKYFCNIGAMHNISNEILKQCFTNATCRVGYLDNIFVTGKSNDNHLKALREICTRLEKYGFKVDLKKCDLFKERVDILGNVIETKTDYTKRKTKSESW